MIIACAAALAFLVILPRGARGTGAYLVFAAIAVLVVGPALRDAWAWFGATADEREAFRRYVASRSETPRAESGGRDRAP